MNKRGDTLEVMVVLVVAPCTVEGLAGFKRQRGDRRLIESGGIGAGEVFLEHLEIFAVEGLVVMVAANQRRGLEFVDERVGALELPVGVGLVPHTVKPDASDIA